MKGNEYSSWKFIVWEPQSFYLFWSKSFTFYFNSGMLFLRCTCLLVGVSLIYHSVCNYFLEKLSRTFGTSPLCLQLIIFSAFSDMANKWCLSECCSTGYTIMVTPWCASCYAVSGIIWDLPLQSFAIELTAFSFFIVCKIKVYVHFRSVKNLC